MSYKPLSGVLPHVKPRTNLATVTMPVRLASAKEIERVNDNGEISPYGVAASSTIEVPQFAILLTRKGPNMPKLRSGSKLPVFSQLNRIKAKGNNFKARRADLLRNLKFAGIALTHAKREEDVGDSNLMAAVIGGSHTVMSYRHDHNEDDPIRPGTVVRWTLPGHGVGGSQESLNDVPVKYTGTGNDILPELEPVDESRLFDDVKEYLADEEGHKTTPDKYLDAYNIKDAQVTGQKTLIEQVLKAYDNLRSREIGTVICDNGRGSIDIRLK